MSLSCCFSHSPLPLKIKHLGKPIKPCGTVCKRQPFTVISNGVELCNKRIVKTRVNLVGDWSFIRGSRVVAKPNATRSVHYPKSSRIQASCDSFFLLHLLLFLNSLLLLHNACVLYSFKLIQALCSMLVSRIFSGFDGSQLVSSVFTLGTVAVLPFYTLMVLAPKSDLTKQCMESNIPYVVLGILYAYLLYLSWTPETVKLIFASKYLLPELSSIGKMFSSELTLASAWIHLLVVDLFAARQVFEDGQQNQVETRHSVSFCLFFCPIGILAHVITKAMTKTSRKEGHGL
ncbi:uncharacterized protein DS421_14g483720 [Arachis hypogaea]|nr:protein ABA DEFICIENT 4, chloroplastic-like isoform X1 [Arachis hypogaea]XP_025697277.1 protein ABA DEFICIENT 4, chloroplastic-like isoform X1 [Arachis hypogaea]QHO09725.1 uncharacterized protein DS421_14g483720 [Arachis hypogaea]